MGVMQKISFSQRIFILLTFAYTSVSVTIPSQQDQNILNVENKMNKITY